MTLREYHAAALRRAMELSRQRQDLTAHLGALEREQLEVAGKIDLLETLIAEESTRGE
jgi:hypothetical protein